MARKNVVFHVKSVVMFVFLACHVFGDVTTTQANSMENERTNEPLLTSTNKSDSLLDSYFFDCLKVIGENNIDYDKEFVSCIKIKMMTNLKHLNSANLNKINLFDGFIELERRKKDTNRASKSISETNEWFRGCDNNEVIFSKNVADDLNNFTKTYALKIRVIDGLKVRLSRSIEDNSLRLGVEMDEDEDDGDEDDEGGREGLSSLTNTNKKKKKKSSVNKRYKKFLSMLPMFFIPFFIQAALLPLFLATLKLIAIKSAFIGKLAIFLVAFNALRNASIRKKQDQDMEHIAVEHYGFNGEMEYGAYVNGRNL